MNKIIVSVVLTIILILGINKFTDVIYHVEKPKTSAYQVGVATVSSPDTEKSSEISQSGDIMALFASVSVEEGAKIFKKCAACHSITEGGANKIGPALYGVLGRKVGAIQDYKYSQSLTEYGKEWTFEEMNGYLRKPQTWIKGTKMSFAGLRKEKDRASVILFLNQYSDNPLPLP